MKNILFFTVLALGSLSYSQDDKDNLVNNQLEQIKIKIIEIENNIILDKQAEKNLNERLNFLRTSLEKQELAHDSMKIKISSFDSLLLKLNSNIDLLNKDFINKTKVIQKSLEKTNDYAENLSLGIENLNLEINKVKESSSKNKNNIIDVNEELIESEKIGLYIVMFSLLIILIVYVILSRKWNTETKKISKKQNELFDQHLKDSQKLTDWLIANSEDKLKNKDKEHTFAIKCADQINRIKTTVYEMDSSSREYKLLDRSCRKLEEVLKNKGYIITKYRGEIYRSGMIMDVQIDPRSESADIEGKEIIRVLSPEVQYDGKVIQSANVIVK
tara:strand:+ start:840 stop:1829 length:990 start_codon:yes stop_codon:yes gene_type:complete